MTMFLRLPYLLPLTPAYLDDCFSFWPGLPGAPDGSWQADGCPFDENAARHIFEQLSRLGLPELEAMRLALSRQSQQADLRLQSELDALASFSGRKARPAFAIAREQAHKVLLWRLVMERQARELADLEEACARAEAQIPAHFAEDHASSHIEPARVFYTPRLPDETLDAWRPVAVSAGFFAPCDMAILAEGPMFEEMREFLDFTPAPLHHNARSGHTLLAAKAPLWAALGHSHPENCADERINNVYNTERSWLGWMKI